MNIIKYIFLIGTLVFFSCKNKDNNDASLSSLEEVQEDFIFVSKAQFTTAKMELGSTKETDFENATQASGIINVPPNNQATISAFYGGYIKSNSLLIGNKVKKGERLIRLENPEYINMQQNYLETAEQLNYLKSEYDRQKTMLEENITSQKNFLKAESDYKTAVAKTNSLKKSLEMLHIQPQVVLDGHIVSEIAIYSPIDGYITQVFVNTGAYVSPSDKIMEIIQTDAMHLELKVFEKDLMPLKKGQKIRFKVPEASKEIFDSELQLVGANIDPKTRMATLYGQIFKEDLERFSVGMFIEADITTDISKRFALPGDAVIELEGKYYVLLLEEQNDKGYTFHPIEVMIEANYNGFISFKTDLDPEATFLTKGGFALLQVEGAAGHSH